MAFLHKGFIPLKYTCDGDNVNPPLSIEKIPPGTKSLTLILYDPDAPYGSFDHWLVWNISPSEIIKENSVPGIVGKNSTGNNNYMGPCPPTDATHSYFFKVYALDTMLDVQTGSDKKTLKEAMKGHVLATGEIMGFYKKMP